MNNLKRRMKLKSIYEKLFEAYRIAGTPTRCPDCNTKMFESNSHEYHFICGKCDIMWNPRLHNSFDLKTIYKQRIYDCEW